MKNVTLETNVTVAVNGTITTQLLNTTVLVADTEEIPFEKCKDLLTSSQVIGKIKGCLFTWL